MARWAAALRGVLPSLSGRSEAGPSKSWPGTGASSTHGDDRAADAGGRTPNTELQAPVV